MSPVRLRATALALTATVAASVAAALPSAVAAPKRPDLVVSKLVVTPTTAAPGATVSLAVTVRNGGKATARASVVRVFATTKAAPAKNAKPLVSAITKKVAVRKTLVVRARVKMPRTAGTSVRFLACADGAGKVKESKEKNNCRAVTVTVRGATPTPSPSPKPGPAPVATPGSVPTPAPTATPAPTPTPGPTPDTSAPVTTITSAPAAVIEIPTGSVSFSADEAATFTCALDDAAPAACTSPFPLSGLLAGEHRFTVFATDTAGNQDESPAVALFRFAPPAPAVGPTDAAAPDPASLADAPVLGEATPLRELTDFLFTGGDPIQDNVAPGTIRPERAGVIRGSVRNRLGGAVAGVRVTVLDHDEYGRTATGTDGEFDIALNGGEPLTLVFEREGYVTAQRTVEPDRGDYGFAEPVVLVPFDAEPVAVDLSGTAAYAVAEGSPVTDGDGQREATLLFEKGTDATMTVNGVEQPLPDDLTVRATEYTVGNSGPDAMPGELPDSSAYTYAAEFSIDEAVEAGATDVEFDKPVVTYVDNFLGFPAGTTVPAGYYDREQGAWVPSRDGVVIGILGESDGSAQVDADGDGDADSAGELAGHGIDAAELRVLASRYDAPKRLWRVEIGHFTPWDFNWPFGLPDNAARPANPPPAKPKPKDPDPCKKPGSIIGCEDGTLGEALPVLGTPFGLHYSTDRTRGYRSSDTLRIPLVGTPVPPSLRRIELDISVAGRTFHQEFPSPTAGQVHEFVWDGLDSYGRRLQGEQPVTTKVTYVYPAEYKAPATFASSFASVGSGPVVADRSRGEIRVAQDWAGTIGGFDVPAGALGGWSLDVHHAYDSVGRTLVRGDGTSVTAEGAGFDVTSTVVARADAPFGAQTRAPLDFPSSMVAAPDGALLVADTGSHVVRRIAPDGTASILAGTDGTAGDAGDGAVATAAQLNAPTAIALGPDGSVVIADTGNDRLRHVGADGVIRPLAGTGVAGDSGDGGPATDAQFDAPAGVAVAADGAVYVADTGNARIRRVSPAGTEPGRPALITTEAGNGIAGDSGDGGPGRQARLDRPRGLALESDGSLLVADTGNHRIRRLDVGGVLTAVAGTGVAGDSGDGGSAPAARLREPRGVFVDRDGAILVADSGNHRVRRVRPEGTIETLLGSAQGEGGDGGPSGRARMDFPVAVSSAANGDIVVAEGGSDRIRRFAPALPSLALGETVIPSADGSEAYIFDARGRHLRTVDALLGVRLYLFGYDGDGRLVTVTDRDGQVTTIVRSGTGTPLRIQAPEGKETDLDVDGRGFLVAVRNPADEQTAFTYADDGLLTSLTDAQGGTTTFTYDSVGRLATDTAPGGETQTLQRTFGGDGTITVEHTAPDGVETTYTTRDRPTGERERVRIDPDGGETTVVRGRDGVVTITGPNGLQEDLELEPDPRWGMTVPFVGRSVMRTPGGQTTTVVTEREATFTDADDPLSLATMTVRRAVNGRAPYEDVLVRSTRTATMTSPLGRVSRTRLDATGAADRLELPGQAAINVERDANGRVTSYGREGRVPATFTYGAAGDLVSSTKETGATTTYTHDAAGRVLTETLPGGAVMELGYDARGNRTSLETPLDRQYTTQFDARGRGVTSVAPTVIGGGDGTTSRSFPNARVGTTTRVDDRTATVEYDSIGRASGLREGTDLTDVDWLVGGRLGQLVAPNGISHTFAYDGPLRTSVAQAGGPIAGTTSFTYDDDQRLVSATLTGTPAVGRAYDADGGLTQVGSLSFTRDPATSRVLSTSVGNVTTAYDTDQFLQLNGITATAGGPAFDVDYTRDQAGRVTQRVDALTGAPASVTESYTYDAQGRLATVTRAGVTTSYAYDLDGNRTSVTEGLGIPRTATFDAQDRILTDGATTFTWTQDGELASRTNGAGTTTYTYDRSGQLLSADLPGAAPTVSYDLDALGRRVGVRHNGTLVRGFIYGGEGIGPSAETDGSGTIVSRFVYATRRDVPDYVVRGGTTYKIVTDHLGSVRMVVNATTNAVTQRIDYDAWGAVLQDTNAGFQPFGYAGGLTDQDTGLVRFLRRDYDPSTGRYTSKDPLRFNGGDHNLYRRVGGDPVNAIDPSGEIAPVAVAGVALASGVVNGAFSAAGAAIQPGATLGSIGAAGARGAVAGVVATGIAAGVAAAAPAAAVTAGGTAVAAGLAAAGGLLGGVASEAGFQALEIAAGARDRFNGADIAANGMFNALGGAGGTAALSGADNIGLAAKEAFGNFIGGHGGLAKDTYGAATAGGSTSSSGATPGNAPAPTKPGAGTGGAGGGGGSSGGGGRNCPVPAYK